MGVRKTESRIPENVQAADLGQAAVATDGRCVLVSFIFSPLVIHRENTYVVFVTDTALATAVTSFEWSAVENSGAPTTQTTDFGEFSYTPQATGSLTLTVRLLNAAAAEQATLSLTQDVVVTNAELENLITASEAEPGPGVGNVDVARELVNDHNPYYQSVTLQAPEAGDGFKRFVFSTASDGALQHTPAQRKAHLNELAASLNGTGGDFATLSAEGVGVCAVRPVLQAMVLPAVLPWTELPDAPTPRATAEEQLRQTLAGLDENKRIDLFNLIRFPKSNITQCGRILEALRNRYFSGTNFNDVLAGMSGTRAHWISRHYREGPIAHT